MQEITLTITVDEANQILDALSSKPFKEVFELIGKIQQQATSQFQQTSVQTDQKQDREAQ